MTSRRQGKSKASNFQLMLDITITGKLKNVKVSRILDQGAYTNTGFLLLLMFFYNNVVVGFNIIIITINYSKNCT